MPLRRSRKFHECKKCNKMYESYTKRKGICPKCNRKKKPTTMNLLIATQKKANQEPLCPKLKDAPKRK